MKVRANAGVRERGADGRVANYNVKRYLKVQWSDGRSLLQFDARRNPRRRFARRHTRDLRLDVTTRAIVTAILAFTPFVTN